MLVRLDMAVGEVFCHLSSFKQRSLDAERKLHTKLFILTEWQTGNIRCSDRIYYVLYISYM